MNSPLMNAARSRTEKPDLSMFNMHTHENYEIYCFLSGDAQYFVEGTVYPLSPGDIMILKKAEAHSLLISSCTPYERIVVNFYDTDIVGENKQFLCEFLDNRPLGKFNRYPARIFKNSNWLYYLKKICGGKTLDARRLYLTVLLCELCESSSSLHTDSEPLSDNIIDIIAFINERLTEDIGLDDICRKFYISKTHLNRRFKRITGCTVWSYILTKRLLLAKELLQSGVTPTAVSARCGFNDYCSFFRAYKSKFGIPPKEDHKK